MPRAHLIENDEPGLFEIGYGWRTYFFRRKRKWVRYKLEGGIHPEQKWPEAVREVLDGIKQERIHDGSDGRGKGRTR